MEIKQLKLNQKKREIGIINVFLIPEVGDMDCGDLIINEYPDKYEVIAIEDRKMDQYDLSSALYEFITLDHYDEKKPFVYIKQPVSLTKTDEYYNVFQKLNPIFNQIAI